VTEKIKNEERAVSLEIPEMLERVSSHEKSMVDERAITIEKNQFI